MTPETLAHIRADVQNAMVENRNTDPALLPDLLDYLLTELGKIATADYLFTEFAREWADDVLEASQLRAISQIPFAERAAADVADPPYDPDWRNDL